MADIVKRDTAQRSSGLATGSLANEINAEHQAFEGSLKKTAEHGIRCGELLSEAKEQCPHGTWLGWLEKNFEGSERSAQVYMRMYRSRDEIRAKYADSADLSIAGALKEIAAPAEDIYRLPPDMPKRERTIIERAREYKYLSIPLFSMPGPGGSLAEPERRRGDVAQVAWEALLEQGRRYSEAQEAVQDAIRETGEAPLELTERMVEELHKLRWWVSEVEWIESIVRACDWPPGRGMPKAAHSKDHKNKTLNQLYDDSEEPHEYGLPSPRGMIREWLGDVV